MINRKTYTRISSMIGTTILILALGVGSQRTLGQSPELGEFPAELERFYTQELTFGSCASFATTSLDELLYVDPFECARLEVPLNYDDPEGETMQIGVLRLPAQGAPEERIGSLVINPGGPGGIGDAGCRFCVVGFTWRSSFTAVRHGWV